MDQLLLLAHQFTQYEYITYSILALMLPLIMHLGALFIPNEISYRQVFRSYLITLGAFLFVITYIVLSLVFKIEYSVHTPLVFTITIFSLIFEFLYFQYNKYTILFAILIPFLLSTLLLTNQFHWSISVLFIVPFILTSIIFFFVFRKDEK